MNHKCPVDGCSIGQGEHAMRAISWSGGKVCHIVGDPDRSATTLCGSYFMRQPALRITPITDAHMPLCRKCVAYAHRAAVAGHETLPELSNGKV